MNICVRGRKKLIRPIILCFSGLFCNGTADTFGGCWNHTVPGESQTITCPPLLKKSATGDQVVNLLGYKSVYIRYFF